MLRNYPGATWVSLRAFGVRPVLTAKTLVGFSGCTSSTSSRCFRTRLPEQSWDELELLREIQEEIVRALELPYRVVSIAAGDLGPAAAKKYDLEVWLPSEGRYREATSCSNYLDYSARRMGTRVKSDQGTVAAHTLNGTACAIGRTLVFLFEHNQQTDGSFVVPEVLRPFCGIDVIPAAG